VERTVTQTLTVASPTTVTQSGKTITTTVTVPAGVAAVSTSSTPAAIAPTTVPPKTGADVPFLTGLVLLLSGLSLLGWSLRRTARPLG